MNLKFFLDRAKEPSTWRGAAIMAGDYVTDDARVGGHVVMVSLWPAGDWFE